MKIQKIPKPRNIKLLLSWALLLCNFAFAFAQTDILPNQNNADTSKQLDEVVVTALGIKREKKALGYAVSDVGEQSVALRPEADVSRLLSGQAAGLDVVGSSGMTGSGTSVNIRGFSSITGSTSPLWVVDGVPFNSETKTDENSFINGNTASSRFLDLDPNSIESISVLKGLSATVLYGEAGRNGVILVTTKNGASSKNLENAQGLNISVSQSVNLTRAANIPETQTNWGGGFNNKKGYTFYSNWGGRTDGELMDHIYDRAAAHFAPFRQQYDSVKYPYKDYGSVKKFFDRTGVSTLTSVSISGGSDKTKVSATISYLSDNGFIETNTLNKINLGLGISTDLGHGFSLKGTMNFAKTDYKTPPIAYSSGSGAPYGYSLFGDIMYTPLTIDLMGLPYENPTTHAHVYYREDNGIQNPRWTLYNVSYQENVIRTFGNIGLSKEFKKIGLSVQYRLGVDLTTTDATDYANKGGAATSNNANLPLGYMKTKANLHQVFDHLFLLDYSKNFNKFYLALTAGVNYRYISDKTNDSKSTDQIVYGLIKHDNFRTYSNTSDFSEYFSNGAFLQGTLGYADAIFLNLGARHTLTSVLEVANNQILYPSVSLSFLPTTIFPSLADKDILNYLKLRVGYATSANLPDPYLTRQTTALNSRNFVTNTGDIVTSARMAKRLANPNLKPELLSEFEVGLESKLFRNKVSIDFTYFYKVSSDQILLRGLDPSTGYENQYINAGGLTNQGIELNLGYTIVQHKDWNVQTNFIFYTYKNIVKDIPAEVKQVLIDGFPDLGNFAENGKPINVIKGSYFEKAPNGERLVDASTGNYIVSSEIKVIGDPNPDFKLSGIFSIAYKFVRLSARLDYTHGGQVYSVTARSMLGRGLAKETDIDRWQSAVLKGVNRVIVENANQKSDTFYVTNTTQVGMTTAYFENAMQGAAEISIYNATVFRVREVSLTLSMPPKWIKSLQFVKGISLSVIGSNLFYFAPGFPDGYNVDPEVNALGAGRNGRGMEMLTGPTATKYSFALKVTF